MDEEQMQNQPEQNGSAPGEPTGRQVRKTAAPGQELYLNVRTVVLMMAAFILVFTFVARVIVVSGPSMENTLYGGDDRTHQGGDVILVWSLGYTPKRGDIVVLTQREYQEDSIIKRVIATEGQTVDIDYWSSQVYVDGEALEEDYIKEPMEVPAYGEYNSHVTVPEGCIFVMGDNRNESADSRYPAIGVIDTRCVIGRGMAVLFPFGRFQIL